jgi:BMFP domain-containing protein YqiC
VLDSIDDARKMPRTSPLEELSARISEFLAASPARDLEKNLRALLAAAFAKLDLATREEFEVQTRTLARTREKLAELERRVVELEARLGRK